ncbi:hypothetical protein GF343_05485 [Candidatus Woesearchaeota archaeon]|nr:hypothetical protein [Candidatus Woesearchaeota archaeon]
MKYTEKTLVLDSKKEKALVRAINKISEQGLVREFLQKQLKTSKKHLNKLSDEELTKLILTKKRGYPCFYIQNKTKPSGGNNKISETKKQKKQRNCRTAE